MKAGSTLRTIFALLVGCVLLVLVMMLGTYWRLKYRSRQAGDVLVAEAWALTSASERVARPPHTDSPLPGTLHEALEPLMPELDHLYEDGRMLSSDNSLLQKYEDVQHGKRPLSELPVPYRELFERNQPLIQRALRASRAELGGLPKGLRDLDEPDHRWSDKMLSKVLGLAALEARSQLEDGQAGAALETCLDGLALARDVAYGSGILGAESSASGYELLFHPCADALGRAPPEGQKQATLALRRLREGLRPLSWAVREESVSFSLGLVGEVLAPEQLEMLPEGARYRALHPPSAASSPASSPSTSCTTGPGGWRPSSRSHRSWISLRSNALLICWHWSSSPEACGTWPPALPHGRRATRSPPRAWTGNGPGWTCCSHSPW
ncbi:hypothetical protein [Archangium gephyra]|uniref:hypothetical protein n=1 Tax=Archangium gephyra TaxID=48 RepID=UPI0006495BBF|nr:hypothetical protein [Archangium gephyra]